jgi:hypothetical protein
MTSSDNQLFSPEEALVRLGENREQGCLIVSKGTELIHIYVQDGFIVRASSNGKENADAVQLATGLKDASYTWMRGIQPPNPAKNTHINIVEITARKLNIPKPKLNATSRIAGAPKKEIEAQFRYFLVPQDRLMDKIYLTKTSTVIGRDPSCDLFIDNTDVSWRHCLLDVGSRGVSILDLNSTNGTFVNGILIRNAPLTPGDRIELGPCVFALNREAMGAL